MEFTKSAWSSDGDNVRIQMPFAKVDVEKRLVSGFATLDNIDQQGDIVLASASSKAFTRFRGNIREMHNEKIAAGRMVNFTEDEFYDPESDTTYKGVYVTAYISEGAPDTWAKVKDGTLSGFSIGGKLTDYENQWNKDASTNVRVVKAYDLIELSLVDSPANQLANVDSIHKSVVAIEEAADGSALYKGMAAETEIRNVFWCEGDRVSKTRDSDTADCTFCGKTMTNIGWIEAGSNNTEKVRDVVTKFLGAGSDANANEGGVESVTEKNEKKEEVVAEVVEETKPVVEKTDSPEEVTAETVDETADANDLTKMFDDLKTEVVSHLEKAATSEDIDALQSKFEEFTKSVEEKTSGLESKIEGMEKNVAELKTESADVTKRLGDLESETAIKKSVDKTTDDSIEKSAESESLFKGTFLSLDRF